MQIKKVKSIARHFNLLNVLLISTIILMAGYTVLPLLNLSVKYTLPSVKTTTNSAGESTGETRIPSLSDFVVIADENLFHPDRKIPPEKKEEQPLEFRLTPGEKEVLKAVEESVTKNGYRTKLRFIYVGRREGFDRGFISGVSGALHQFNDLMLNALIQDNETKTFANYIWIEPRMRYAQRKIFTRYLDRDFDGPNFVLNSEELATLYHMPDMSVASPSIARVEAKKGGAPLNLPVE